MRNQQFIDTGSGLQMVKECLSEEMWRNAHYLQRHLEETCLKFYGTEVWKEVESCYRLNKHRPAFAWINPKLRRLDEILISFRNVDTIIDWNGLKGCLVSRNKMRNLPQVGKFRTKPLLFMNLSSAISIHALEVPYGSNQFSGTNKLKVLDMCAGPGSKSCLISWVAPRSSDLIFNEVLCERRWMLAKTLMSFVDRTCTNYDVTSFNGVHFGSFIKSEFDRVLVDAPCTNDRYLFDNKMNVEQFYRVNDGKQMCELQKSLLCSAIESARKGAIVLYSTCTLDARQNNEIIHWLLNSKLGNCVELERFDLGPFKNFVHSLELDEGILVLPTAEKNWGPLFVSKLRKVSDT